MQETVLIDFVPRVSAYHRPQVPARILASPYSRQLLRSVASGSSFDNEIYRLCSPGFCSVSVGNSPLFLARFSFSCCSSTRASVHYQFTLYTLHQYCFSIQITGKEIGWTGSTQAGQKNYTQNLGEYLTQMSLPSTDKGALRLSGFRPVFQYGLYRTQTPGEEHQADDSTNGIFPFLKQCFICHMFSAP